MAVDVVAATLGAIIVVVPAALVLAAVLCLPVFVGAARAVCVAVIAARAVRVAVIVRGRAHCRECARRVHTVLRKRRVGTNSGRHGNRLLIRGGGVRGVLRGNRADKGAGTGLEDARPDHPMGRDRPTVATCMIDLRLPIK